MTEQEPQQEAVPTPVVPDEVIKPVINEELLKELNKSLNDLKEVQSNLFEQQKKFTQKGDENDEEQLTY